MPKTELMHMFIKLNINLVTLIEKLLEVVKNPVSGFLIDDLFAAFRELKNKDLENSP